MARLFERKGHDKIVAVVPGALAADQFRALYGRLHASRDPAGPPVTVLGTSMYFTLTKNFLQPLPMALLALFWTVAALWRGRREGRRQLIPVTVVTLVLVAISSPAVVYPVIGALEWPYPPVSGRPEGVDAIVVLSGGIKEPDQTRRAPELAEDTLNRCLLAAELYHQGVPCPVIVTGGALRPGSKIPPVAPSMRNLLVRLGVAGSDIIVEPRARTTYENAVETHKILDQRGLRKVALVTEAVHMGRSLRTFRKQGVVALPAACLHRATEFKLEVGMFVPSPEGVSMLMAALHEWLGLAWYKASGRI